MSNSVPYDAMVPPLTPRYAGAAWTMRRVVRGGGLALLLLLVAFLFVAPVAMLIVGMLRNGPPGSAGTWSTDGLVRTFSDPRTYLALQNSITYALSTTALAVA